MNHQPSALILALQQLLGEQHVFQETQALSPFLAEKRARFSSSCLAVVSPASTEEVSDCVKLCADHQVSIVPQGGNTGLVAGTVSQPEQIILSTRRLNKIREIDVENYSITAESGVILENIQNAVKDQNRFFPLSLGAQGSCHIGGNLATNAGGINVLRYGNTRDLCLGIEVVTANGDILSDLTGLRKNNTGYDLKNLFIGSEGTLGIITAATLKLFPTPKSSVTALVALPNLESANKLFGELREASSDQISTFELIPRLAVVLTEQYFAQHVDPFESDHPWYVLTALHANAADFPLTSCLENTLEKGLEQEWVNDAVIAQSEAQAQKLILFREHLVETQAKQGGAISHDVSVPISRIAEFIECANREVIKAIPGARPYPFGHFGDGNIHYNVLQPVETTKAEYFEKAEMLNQLVYKIVDQFSGSFSAEHGVGLLKIGEMSQYKNPTALVTMRAIKIALDPDNLFNPGKVIPAQTSD
ncbi:MAG: FAD/FMN-containing dehydrogenase [Saprospiraceae bacterium]|jgi:FAD/FMN-containing dehydrogenase